jgi:hypothetical protein
MAYTFLLQEKKLKIMIKHDLTSSQIYEKELEKWTIKRKVKIALLIWGVIGVLSIFANYLGDIVNYVVGVL